MPIAAIRPRPAGERSVEAGPPPDFAAATWPKHTALLNGVAPLAPFSFASRAAYESQLESHRRAAWEKRTGLKPEESAFTFILPIHNEEAMLGSCLRSIAGAHFHTPAAVRANFVFVTNGCTDNTVRILREFMAGLGELKPYSSNEWQASRKVSSNGVVVTAGNTNYFHIHSERRGKGNALNIGNEFALASKHGIVITADANNWIEPDSLAVMFGEFHRRQRESGGKMVVMDGAVRNRVDPESRTLYSAFVRRRIAAAKSDTMAPPNVPGLAGCFMAWQPEWYARVGGTPPSPATDYALTLLARADGNTFAHGKAVIWNYAPSTLRDNLRMKVRSARARLRLREIFHDRPEVLEMINTDREWARPFGERLRGLLNSVKRHPQRAPLTLTAFVLTEAALLKARYEHSRAADPASWDPIASTKGAIKEQARAVEGMLRQSRAAANERLREQREG